jgi:hypothetical protein
MNDRRNASDFLVFHRACLGQDIGGIADVGIEISED